MATYSFNKAVAQAVLSFNDAILDETYQYFLDMGMDGL